MTAKQTKDKLIKSGIKLDIAERSKTCVAEFCVQMENRQYGMEETAQAFAWFENGWKRAASRLA